MSHVRPAQETNTKLTARDNVTPLFPTRQHIPADPSRSKPRPANTLWFDASCNPFVDPHSADVALPVEESIRRWGTTRVSLFDLSNGRVVLEDPANQASAPRRRKRRCRRWRKSKALAYKAGLSSIADTIGTAKKAGKVRSERLPWRKIGSCRWRHSGELKDR